MIDRNAVICPEDDDELIKLRPYVDFREPGHEAPALSDSDTQATETNQYPSQE